MAMQEELRIAEVAKGDRRLAMRIVITLGDVLHEEGSLVGDPAAVYRIEQTYRTRVIADQTIVVTDLRRFAAVVETVPMTEVEKILDRLHELIGNVCRDFSGANRFSVGDSYCLTFPDAQLAIAAVERLAEDWGAPGHREGSLCPLGVVVCLIGTP